MWILTCWSLNTHNWRFVASLSARPFVRRALQRSLTARKQAELWIDGWRAWNFFRRSPFSPPIIAVFDLRIFSNCILIFYSRFFWGTCDNTKSASFHLSRSIVTALVKKAPLRAFYGPKRVYSYSQISICNNCRGFFRAVACRTLSKIDQAVLVKSPFFFVVFFPRGTFKCSLKSKFQLTVRNKHIDM